MTLTVVDIRVKTTSMFVAIILTVMSNLMVKTRPLVPLAVNNINTHTPIHLLTLLSQPKPR